jgi:hypothetical protein
MAAAREGPVKLPTVSTSAGDRTCLGQRIYHRVPVIQAPELKRVPCRACHKPQHRLALGPLRVCARHSKYEHRWPWFLGPCQRAPDGQLQGRSTGMRYLSQQLFVRQAPAGTGPLPPFQAALSHRCPPIHSLVTVSRPTCSSLAPEPVAVSPRPGVGTQLILWECTWMSPSTQPSPPLPPCCCRLAGWASKGADMTVLFGDPPRSAWGCCCQQLCLHSALRKLARWVSNERRSSAWRARVSRRSLAASAASLWMQLPVAGRMHKDGKRAAGLG